MKTCFASAAFGIFCLLQLVSASVAAEPLRLVQTIEAPEDAERMGEAVAFTARGALVSVHFDGHDLYRSGAVLFGLDLATSELTALPQAEGQSSSHWAARRLHVDGDRTLVCEKVKDRVATPWRSVMIRTTPPTGEILARFELPEIDGYTLKRFGDACAMHGNTVAIGAQWIQSETRHRRGVVHLFEADTGALRQTMESPPVQTPLTFSQALAMNGRFLAIASTGANARVGAMGEVTLYDRATGQPLHVFRRPENGFEGRDGRFGARILIEGDRLIIASPSGAEKGHTGGTVWVFDLTTYALEHRFQSPLDGKSADFGRAMALHDGKLLIGQPTARVAGRAEAGMAFLFDLETGALLQSLTAPKSPLGAQFGRSLALGPQGALIAAPTQRLGQWRAGALYHYRWNVN
ncbi:WD40 repeat domain-containing protein [Primorskyibacter sp. S187A]|uniref:WD40 repeat domain-containing protein n=1 Tax=Primorskyibacter sp. S187A TaxID=3415130 RepID=UPI003C7C4A60